MLRKRAQTVGERRHAGLFCERMERIFFTSSVPTWTRERLRLALAGPFSLGARTGYESRIPRRESIMWKKRLLEVYGCEKPQLDPALLFLFCASQCFDHGLFRTSSSLSSWLLALSLLSVLDSIGLIRPNKIGTKWPGNANQGCPGP